MIRVMKMLNWLKFILWLSKSLLNQSDDWSLFNEVDRVRMWCWDVRMWWLWWLYRLFLKEKHWKENKMLYKVNWVLSWSFKSLLF